MSDVDWSAHRGSCRIFYAERRCTCGVAPVAAEGTDELREVLAATLCAIEQQQNDMGGQVVRWEHAGSWRRERHLDQADALLAGPLAPLLAKVQGAELAWADGYEACRTGVQRYRNPHRRALGGESRG